MNTNQSPVWGPTQLYLFSTYAPYPHLRRPSPAVFIWHALVGFLLWITCLAIGSDYGLGGLVLSGWLLLLAFLGLGWLHYRHPRAGQALGWASAAYLTYRGIHDDDDHYAPGAGS
jgi:hypothetical protein